MATAELAGAINSDDLIGRTVRDTAGETVGEIDALLLPQDPRVIGGVIDVGSFLGVGGKKVVIPLEQLRVAGKAVRKSGSGKEQLQQAPAYEKPRG